MSTCQQNENRSYMDDDLPSCRNNLVGRNGEVRHVCQCPSWPKCTEWPAVCSHAKPQRTLANLQLQLIILLTVGLSRGPRSELCLILVIIVPFYVQSDL